MLCSRFIGTSVAFGCIIFSAAVGCTPVADGPQPDVGPDATIDAEPPAPIVWCEGATRQVYAPLAGARLEAWPDDFYTRDEPSSPTGLKLEMNEDNAPWIADVEDLLKGALLDLNVLSGFGRNAGAVLTFDGPVGALPAATVDDWEQSLTTDAIQLLDLETDPPTRIPYEVFTNDEDQELILWPLAPLRPGVLHAVVVTTTFGDATGDCIAPSPILRALLTGTTTQPSLQRLHGRYKTLLETTGLAPGDISAATVFTTHDDLQILDAAANDVRARDYDWASPPVCVDEGMFRRCDGTFEALDYRAPEGYVADASGTGGTWALKATVWLPPVSAGAGPHPTVAYGHGLGSSREGGGYLASQIAPLGFAVFAVDAIAHGEHPTATPGSDLAALDFLGIDLTALNIDALALRGNFNQSMLDRLQLVELLNRHPDVDGDGSPDLDTSGFAYHGVSLGGMMGPALLAMSDRFEAAVLSVAGGRLLTFATDNGQIDAFKPFLYDIVGGEAEFIRLLTVAQALVDAADPATHAAHVQIDRFLGQAPDVLMPVAIDDQTVPPSSGKALARALDLPHVGTVFDPVRLLTAGPPLPTTSNKTLTEDTARTAGFFQMDRATEQGVVVPSTHGNVPFGPEGQLQLRHFLETWRDTGRAEIIDPYAVMGTAALP